jgi:hypothetical protein
MDCPIIIFHIVVVIRGADLGSGFRSRILGDGGSVASANAARVSWIRYTHISCTEVRTGCPLELAIAETKVSITVVMLTVIWNLGTKSVEFDSYK